LTNTTNTKHEETTFWFFVSVLPFVVVPFVLMKVV